MKYKQLEHLTLEQLEEERREVEIWKDTNDTEELQEYFNEIERVISKVAYDL